MEEAAMLALMEQRDETVLDALETAYGRSLRTLANNILHDAALTEDCVNETWLKLWNAIPPAKPRHLSAYLYQVCRRTALEMLRREQRRSDTVIALSEELEACLPDPQSNEGLKNAELSEHINAFLGTLSADSRRIFLRRYWYADSVAAIAARYSIGESKVKTSLHRTRKALGDYLRKEGWTI